MSEPFPEAAPDFDDPLGLLRACHQRMLGHCEILEKLARHMELSGVDKDALAAARKVHTYFSTAAVLHHQDEEQDLFPLLVRSTLKMAELIHGLKQDHERLDQAWRDIAPMLAQPSHIGDPQQFTVLANNFAELYRDHIAKENEELLDRAQHMLSSEQLKKIGKAMKERRQRPAQNDWD